MDNKPSIGRIVHYVSDGRSGFTYELPAIVTCTQDSYNPDERNQLVMPESDHTIHLSVFSPGETPYSELNVPYDETKKPRTWHWPERS